MIFKTISQEEQEQQQEQQQQQRGRPSDLLFAGNNKMLL